MVTTLLRLLNAIFTVYSLAIILRALLPWLRIPHSHPAMRFLVAITEPLLAPLRRFIPSAGGLDFTPMAALVLLWVGEWVLTRLIVAVF
jgi:YggT family protein